MDEKTSGGWRLAYGKDGYDIAGSQEKIPAYARVAFSTEIKKVEMKWPDGVRRFSYRKKPDLPPSAGGPRQFADRLQCAARRRKAVARKPARHASPLDAVLGHRLRIRPERGRAAIRRRNGNLEAANAGMPRKHFFPRQPKSPFDGPVKDGKLVMRRDGETRFVEAALPWSEIPEVKKRLDAGQTIKFDLRVNDNAGPSYELATERSVSKVNSITFHNDWQTHWSNELEFGFEK